MKRIQFQDLYRPFSHRPGQMMMIPKTFWKGKIFPSALHLFCLLSGKEIKLHFDIKGPVTPFTAEGDLQEGALKIYGQSQLGYFRLKLKREKEALILYFEKTPVEGIFLQGQRFFSGDCYKVSKEESPFVPPPLAERISLGVHKLQDLDLIKKRADLREILPLWHAIGFSMPAYEEGGSSPVLDLLKNIQEKREKGKAAELYDDLLCLYSVGFSEGFIPRGHDEDFQGILPVTEKSSLPLSLLKKGAELIRSLLFKQQGRDLFILPCLPSQFVYGKGVDLCTEEGHLIDIEWSKHQVRRVSIKVQETTTILFRFPKEIERYRLKTHEKDRGCLVRKGEEIYAEKGKRLWLDRFQK